MEGLNVMKISEEKMKKYIDVLLYKYPVVEEMLAECIDKMPSDPVPFLLEWLEQKKTRDEKKLVTPEEKQRLKEEKKKLEASMSKVKAEMHEAAEMVKTKETEPESYFIGDEEEEAEIEDDANEEPPADFFKDQSQLGKVHTGETEVLDRVPSIENQEHIRCPRDSFIAQDDLTSFVGDNTCAICLDEFAGSAVTITRCGHIFHTRCLTRAHTCSCPSCRQSIDDPSAEIVPEDVLDSERDPPPELPGKGRVTFFRTSVLFSISAIGRLQALSTISIEAEVARR